MFRRKSHTPEKKEVRVWEMWDLLSLMGGKKKKRGNLKGGKNRTGVPVLGSNKKVLEGKEKTLKTDEGPFI